MTSHQEHLSDMLGTDSTLPTSAEGLFGKATKVETMEVDFNSAFVLKSLNKVDWPALRQAAAQVGHNEDLPEALETGYENNEELIKKIHHVLLQIEVIEGHLECPETGRQFPITNGCPNMLLNEDEVGN